MNKSQTVLEKLLSLNEMAKVGEFSDGVVFVNSEDHGSPHMHFLKDGKLIAKIEIPSNDVKNLVIVDYGIAYKDYLITSLVKWLNQVSVKGGVKGKNWQIAKFLWDSVHNI